MPNIKQSPDGSMGIEGVDAGPGPFVMSNGSWNATATNKVDFVAPRALIIQSITARVEVAGTDASAVTAVINKAPSGTAITAGTAVHTGSINLKGTAATNQTLTLAASPTAIKLNAGDTLGIVFTGTLTAALGVVTVAMTPA